MEVRENSKGRGIYATKKYQPWDMIHVESAIFAISSVCTKEYVESAKKTKDKHSTESFVGRMLSFVASAPASKVKSQHAHLKFPLLYLLNGGKAERFSHLAKTSKLGVTDKQIRTVAKTFKLSKEDLKLLAQVVQANGFSIPGLFFTEIGMSIFDKGSMLNHSCNPNAFTFITYDKMIVYARKPIDPNEEITISYKPLCVPDTAKLLDFECQCGSCHRDFTILQEVYDQWGKAQTLEERIDYMLERCREIPAAEFIQLLIESYYEVWAKNATYREKDIYEVIQKFKLKEPDTTWIEAQLLSMILAVRLGYSDHLLDIMEKLRPFIQNKDIIEHIVVATTLIPHIYHETLISILGKLNLLP